MMSMKQKNKNYSGIGGQAVLEGVMMKNEEKYAIAIRKPNGEIDIELENFQGVLHDSKLKDIPLIRGVFNFIDSLTLGTRCLNHSVEFIEEEEGKETKLDQVINKATKGNAEKMMTAVVTVFSILLAILLFIGLPYLISTFLANYILNYSLLMIVEGGIRILIFILYVTSIAFMEDIRRLYAYHGAEHKCINCIERGRPLTVKNVMRSSRLHKRCGTSFIFYVLFISIIFFFFIRVDHFLLKLVLRIALMPVIAGISYEVIRLAGKFDNSFITLLSAPGMYIQKITTKEPTEDMVIVAIVAVESVFDWKQYLMDNWRYKEGDFDKQSLEEDDDDI